MRQDTGMGAHGEEGEASPSMRAILMISRWVGGSALDVNLDLRVWAAPV